MAFLLSFGLRQQKGSGQNQTGAIEVFPQWSAFFYDIFPWN